MAIPRPIRSHVASHARRRSAVGGQTERGGRSASVGRCCFAIVHLSAYLHVLGDLAVPQLGAQASKMTARRIDEFLLAFGGRILEVEQEEVLPLHRYWRHG